MDVLGSGRGAFQIPRLAGAFALIGRVEGQGDEAVLSEPGRVDAADLFLDAAARCRKHESGIATGLIEIGRQMKMAHDVQRAIFENNPSQVAWPFPVHMRPICCSAPHGTWCPS